MLTDSYKYAQTDPNIIFYETNVTNIHHYYIPSSTNPCKTLKDSDVSRYLRLNLNCSWKYFDTYRTGQSLLWKVVFNSDDWTQSECKCPVFFKTYV